MTISKSDASYIAEAQSKNNDFGSFEEFEQYDKSIIESYQDCDVLEYLYWDQGWTQQQIADRYGVDQGTISTWMSEHGIDARHGRPTTHGGVTPDKRGNIEYSSFKVWNGDALDQIHVHRLAACVDHDPHEVFGDDREVHHRLHCRVGVNIPGNLDVLSRQNHQIEHDALEWLTGEQNAERAENILNEVLSG
jgi:hypothetical protein